VTQVTRFSRGPRSAILLLALGAALSAAAQTGDASQSATGTGVHASDAKPAETLYLQLHDVGLDPKRTYHIRAGNIDRPGLHLTLDDGKIAFTKDVAGKITGAFFEGEGEILLMPPNRVERASMALFTGMAILEDRFNTAYFRFNDDTFLELQPFLRATPDAEDFATRWNNAAKNLAELDALRLFVSFSKSLPVSGNTPEAAPAGGSNDGDRFLHARVEGPLLGDYDVFYDSTAYEQIVAGQTKTVAGLTYYNVWTSFAVQDIGAPNGIRKESPQPDEVHLERYKIETRVSPPTSLTADASLEMHVRRGGARAVLFELSRFLQVKQVEVNGKPVEFINNPALEGTQLARRGNDQVAVVFDRPLRAGQELQLHFVYGGDVLSEAGGGLLYVGARGAWYPNRGLTPCDFDLTFQYPEEWTLIATGKRMDDGQTPAAGAMPSERRARWVSERPIALAGFNLGKYERATAHAGTVEVDTYAARGVERNFPHTSGPVVQAPEIRGLAPATATPMIRESIDPSPARNARAVASEAAQAVEFYSEKFGPYPYGSLALTQMPGPESQGWPGLVFLSSMSFLSPDEEAGLHLSTGQSALRRLILAHETAHQWWGDLVLWKSYRDQWIVEALANYSALMEVEAENPQEFRQVLDKYRADLEQKNKDGEPLGSAGPVTLGQRLSSSHFPRGYEAISYGRGTWLFHMLRYMLLDGEQLGTKNAGGSAPTEEPFVRALRKVCERYAGRSISTEELMAVFAEELPPSLQYEGHKSLDWFIESWIQGTALPRFSLHGVKLLTKSGRIAVSGVIAQKDAPDDLVTPVPIYADVGGKNVLLGRVFADGPETSFHLTAPAGTKKIVLDPYGTLLTGR
jgi:hypothetical protein